MSPGEREEGVSGDDGKAGKWDSHRLLCGGAVCVFGRVGYRVLTSHFPS